MNELDRQTGCGEHHYSGDECHAPAPGHSSDPPDGRGCEDGQRHSPGSEVSGGAAYLLAELEGERDVHAHELSEKRQ
jgi:hypothetical protein